MDSLNEYTVWGHLFIKTVSFNFISFQGVLRKWIPHNLHVQSTHTLFQLLSCCWPPDNPALFSLCVWVCKSPLCCVWAVKHPSEQQLPVRSDCYFNSRALGCLRFVCLAVGLGVCPQASPQCTEEEDISRRLKSDSQHWQTQSSLPAGSTPLELHTESFLACLAAEVKGHLSVLHQHHGHSEGLSFSTSSFSVWRPEFVKFQGFRWRSQQWPNRDKEQEPSSSLRPEPLPQPAPAWQWYFQSERKPCYKLKLQRH